jgi:hypothetical protein
MFLTFLVILGLLALMGLGNNGRLGNWLQPKYTQAMDQLQQMHDNRDQGRSVSRNTYFLISTAIVVVFYGVVFWVGSRFGAPAGFLTLFALIPVSAWVFAKLPSPAALTREERDADERAWTAFFEKLFFRVAPLAIVGWLFYKWVERL